MTAVAVDDIAEQLGYEKDSKGYRLVVELSAIEPPPGFAVEAFDSAGAGELLARLGFDPSGPDVAAVVATLPARETDPERWWCLERQVYRLVATMGDPEAERGTWPAFEGPAYSLETRCHFLHVALAVVPHTLSYWRGLGVPDEIAWASLADICRHTAIHREMHGITGTEASWWVTLCLRAELVDLGRLQYNRFRIGGESTSLWFSEEESAAMGAGFCSGDECLGIHIPGGSPLTPESVTESLESAGRFFASFFTVDDRRIATCMSWLLDPQLAEYLAPESNIMSFQRRFSLVPGSYEGDHDVLQFVFRPPSYPPDLASLPQRSAMERAAVAHLRAGRHFQVRMGWLDLPSP